MFETINVIQEFIWTYIILALLVGGAVYFTVRLHGLQFLRLRETFRILSQSNTDEKGAQSNGKRHVNSFQAFAISLSSRVGTGNLAGVASAIFVGGPGAVFWMWVMALFGAATAFVEATLAQLYKRKGADSFYGGPAYYIRYGLHSPWMAIVFALCITFTFGMANQIVQSNTLCSALGDAWSIRLNVAGSPFGANMVIPGIVCMAFVITALAMVIVYGGIQRISRFSAIVVPIMAAGYLLITLYILLVNITQVPAMLRLIVESAFGMRQAAGGVIGIAILQGVKRGLFSNEAGEGSAPNAAATATTSHPVKQGLLQSMGVFVDTLIICTCTAFVIILSGLYTGNEDGILLTGSAMEHFLGSFGRWYLTASIFLFAFSTIIANYFYGETNIRYISNKRWPIEVFRIITGITILLGGFMTLQEAFSVVDLAMAILVIVNMIAILRLSPKVVFLYRDYMKQRRAGQDPVFHAETMPEVINDLDTWK